MNNTLTQEQIRRWLLTYAAVIDENVVLLNELDAAGGDGEHGTNLRRGAQAIRAALDVQEYRDIQSLLHAVAMSVVNSVGGASGALYGTLLLRLSDIGEGATEVTLPRFAAGLASAAEGIAELGRCAPGDKTLLDALQPAVSVLLEYPSKADLEVALGRAAEAAESGRDATSTMVAMVGRATYLGERGVGQVDAGATSMALLIRTLHSVVTTSAEEALER